MFKYDSTGVETRKHYDPVPLGEYELIITDVTPKQTKKGDDMVNVEMEIINSENEELNGRKVWANITFFKDKASKGAGIALHFLSVIDEPCEGEFDVDEEVWRGKKLKAKVGTETYEGKDRNKILFFIKPLGPDGKPATWKHPAEAEDAPF